MAHYLGIDLGGTNIKAAVVTKDGTVIGRANGKSRPEEGLDNVLERIVRFSRKAIKDSGKEITNITAAGIGAPGPVNPKTGILLQAVNLGWGEVRLAERLSKMLELPVYADNDVNVGAYGEYRAGAGKGEENQIAIFIGTGVGAGFIINGKIYSGPCFSAGEIGHTHVLGRGLTGLTSVEQLASRTAIARRIGDMIRAGHASCILDYVNGDTQAIRSKAIAKAWRNNDPLVRNIVTDSLEIIGIAAANAVTLLSVPCVILGGGLAEALGDEMAEIVSKTFAKRVFPPEIAQHCSVLAGQLGDDAGPVGAALLAADMHHK